MSGILCLCNRDNSPVDTNILTVMAQSMSRRGHDGPDIWQKNNIGFGHISLKTTPESIKEMLPFSDGSSGLSITADARIDNRTELFVLLGLGGAQAGTITDSLLILYTYKKWGRRCAEYLVGDFVFLIWDSIKQQLICARDHLGIKPLYYYLSGNIFAAASDVQALLTHPYVPHTLNEARIADFLVTQLEGIDKISTFYHEIYRLPPAHVLTLSGDKMHISEYWRLDPEFETHYKSDNDYTEKFTEIFSRSIRDRLRCNGQVAAMLSGGIDSSSIVAIASSINRQNSGVPLQI